MATDFPAKPSLPAILSEGDDATTAQEKLAPKALTLLTTCGVAKGLNHHSQGLCRFSSVGERPQQRIGVEMDREKLLLLENAAKDLMVSGEAAARPVLRERGAWLGQQLPNRKT